MSSKNLDPDASRYVGGMTGELRCVQRQYVGGDAQVSVRWRW